MFIEEKRARKMENERPAGDRKCYLLSDGDGCMENLHTLHLSTVLTGCYVGTVCWHLTVSANISCLLLQSYITFRCSWLRANCKPDQVTVRLANSIQILKIIMCCLESQYSDIILPIDDCDATLEIWPQIMLPTHAIRIQISRCIIYVVWMLLHS